MTIRYLLALYFFFPFIGISQDISIDILEQEIIAESLIEDQFSFLTGWALVQNMSEDEDLIISVITEDVSMPAAWDLDESLLSSSDATDFPLGALEVFDLTINLDLHINGYNIGDKGTQTIRVIARKLDGTEVYNDTFTLCYTISNLQNDKNVAAANVIQ